MRIQVVVRWLSWFASAGFTQAAQPQKFASIVGSSVTFPTPVSSNGNLQTTTIPNGGPTITYTLGATSAVAGTIRTTSYLTTLTFPSGPTIAVMTKSVISDIATPTPCSSNCVPTIYTTGFIGFTVVTTTSVTRYLETTQLANGQFTVFPTTSTTTFTAAYSGVQKVSFTTFLVGSTVTSTGTAVINGQLQTFTATSLGLATTTLALPANAAATSAPNRVLISAAALVAAGAAIILL